MVRRGHRGQHEIAHYIIAVQSPPESRRPSGPPRRRRPLNLALLSSYARVRIDSMSSRKRAAATVSYANGAVELSPGADPDDEGEDFDAP